MQTSDIASNMEGSNELREIKKEIIEARGLIIKSNNLSNSLNAEVRSIAKRQVGYERHMGWTSVAAYVIFVVVIWAGVQIVYNQRQVSLEETIDKHKEIAAEAQKELEALKKERPVNGKTSGEDLMAIYSLIHAHERSEAIEAYEALDQTALSPLEAKLLGDVIEGFRADLSMQHYARALDLVMEAQKAIQRGEKEAKFAEAVEEFRSSLRFKGDAGHATAAKIAMANALRLQGKPREGIAILQRLLEDQLDRELSDDALWYLALAHQDAHQKDEARSVLKSLMRQYEDSQYYRAARLKEADLRLHLYSSGSSD